MERPPSPYSSLSDKELEILRLLAAGHTVKSIAARLNRSEPSINERLRDARRKTGVGSSRELARLLDSQKIWDRNIDLSLADAPAKDRVQPPRTGRTWPKGAIIMVFSLSAAALGLALAATTPLHQAAAPQPAHAAAPGQSPLVGSWSLDTSRIPAEERPQSVTIRFSVTPERQWTTVVDMVAPDGARMHAQSTAAPDGVPVAVTGNMGFIDTASLRQPAPNTLVMTLGKNGAPVSTRVYTVSKDRKSMTETIVWAGTTMPGLETTTFTRIR